MRRYSVGQMKEFLKPINLGIAVVLDFVPYLGSADDCAKRYEQDCIKAVFLCTFHAWVTDGREKSIGELVGIIHY